MLVNDCLKQDGCKYLGDQCRPFECGGYIEPEMKSLGDEIAIHKNRKKRSAGDEEIEKRFFLVYRYVED